MRFDWRPSKIKPVSDGIGFESEESRIESLKSNSTFQKSNDLDTDTGTTSYWSDYTVDTSSDEDNSQPFGNYFPWVNIGKIGVIWVKLEKWVKMDVPFPNFVCFDSFSSKTTDFGVPFFAKTFSIHFPASA